jgi:D-sedoheptulose 7-phosphate isomerase
MTILQQLRDGNAQAIADTVSAHEADWQALARLVAECFATQGRVFFAGNGGSACDAMHIAGEFVGRFIHDRAALPAIALTADPGIITAVGNDYGFERIFARQLDALAHRGDIVVAMSTSGSSPNIHAVLDTAKARGVYSVLMTGEKGREVAAACDLRIVVPSRITAHIQEAHMFLLHALARMVEETMGIGTQA